MQRMNIFFPIIFAAKLESTIDNFLKRTMETRYILMDKTLLYAFLCQYHVQLLLTRTKYVHSENENDLR